MKVKRILLSLICMALLFTTPVLPVCAAESPKEEDKTYAPYFFVESNDPETESFPLKKTDVTVNINGVIAETYITQEYTNEGANPINAKYVFPCSTKAAVHGMTMTVGNQMVRAQIQKKEEAKETFDIICGNMDEATFFPFGIGTSVNHYLIEGIANAGQGESFVVTDREDAGKTSGLFKTYMEAPLLTDIQITYEGFDAYHIEPVTPSTLYAQKPITLFGKWLGKPSGTVHITGKCGSKDFVADIPVSEDNIDNSNSTLPYLWARKRVERLSDFGTYNDNEAIKEEVTRIGLTYSMATSYTSFVAVLETIRNPETESTDVEQPNPLPLQVSNLAIGSGYMVGSEPGVWGLMATAGVLVAIGFGKRRRQLTS